MPCDISDFYSTCEIYPGVPLLPIVAIVAIAFVMFMFWPKKKDDYEKPKTIEPDKELYSEFKDIIKTTGYRVPYTSLFYVGHIIKGRVTRWSFYRNEHENLLTVAKKNRSAERIKAQVQKNYKADNFYLIEAIPFANFFLLDWLFTFLYALIGFGTRYYLVDMRFLNHENKHFEMTMFAQQKRFYDKLYVYSEWGQHVIQGMVNHLTLKQILRDQVNHIPQMHYFDYKTGKFAAKARELSNIKTKSWKDREENLEREVDSE